MAARYDLILTQNVAVSGEEFEQKIVNVTKGGLISADASSLPTVLIGGTDTYVLTRDDLEDTGLKWQPSTALIPTPVVVSQGGTGLTTITETNKLLTTNASGAFTVESTLEGSAGKLHVFDPGAAVRLILDGNSINHTTAAIYNYSDVVGDKGYKDLLLGGYEINVSIFVDRANTKVGVFKTPDKTFDVNGDISGDNLYVHATNGVIQASVTSSDLTIRAGEGGITGGDLYLAPGGGSTYGNLYLNERNGVVGTGEVYIKSILPTSASIDYVGIDTNGKLVAMPIRSLAVTTQKRYLPYLSTAGIHVIDHTVSEITVFTYPITWSDFIAGIGDGNGDTLWKLTFNGNRTRDTAVVTNYIDCRIKIGGETIGSHALTAGSSSCGFSVDAYIYIKSDGLVSVSWISRVISYNTDVDQHEFSLNTVSVQFNGDNITFTMRDEKDNSDVYIGFIMLEKIVS